MHLSQIGQTNASPVESSTLMSSAVRLPLIGVGEDQSLRYTPVQRTSVCNAIEGTIRPVMLTYDWGKIEGRAGT